MNKIYKLIFFIFILFILIFYILNNFYKSRNEYTLQVTSRALIIQNEKLLLVSDDDKFWYTPGGKVNSKESLPECLVREVREETGLIVKPEKMLYLEEFLDESNKLHKIEIYFSASIISGKLSSEWQDYGGKVKMSKFFSLNEIKNMNSMAPPILKNGKWFDNLENTYQGIRKK